MQSSRLTHALLETAQDMLRAGVLDDITHKKIMLRHLDERAAVVVAPITGEEIRSLRDRMHPR